MSRPEPLKLLGALAILAFLAMSIFPVSFINSFAQEDDSEYDSQSDEEEQEYVEDEQEEEEYYDEENEQEEAPGDDYSYEDDATLHPVKTTPFDDSVTISEREIVTVNVLVNDRALIGGDTSPRLVEITEPEFGQVTINSDNTITYAPSQVPLPQGYEKTDFVTYTASADGISSYTGTVTLWIQQVNDPPVAYSANYTIKENVQTTFYLGSHDEDNDSLTFTVINETQYGTTEIDSASGILVYTPLFEFSGNELLTFQVSDGSSTSNVGTILITVEEVGGETSVASQDDDEDDELDDEGNSTAGNTKPVADAGSDFDALTEDLVTLDGSASYDIESDSIAYSWSQLTGPEVLLTDAASSHPTFDAPEVESETEMTFELAVSDGNMTDTASVTVTVLPISIDIIPNNFQNEIILDEPEAEIPVAIFGSSAFDASSSVDEESLELGPDTASATRYEQLDSNGDGLIDHISYYRTGDLGLGEGDKSACFSGSVTSENGITVKFYTCQTVKVKPPSI
jgi:hypothetical protein